MEKSIVFVSSLAEAESDDIAYWHDQAPDARIRHLFELRRLNYGSHRISERLQRILEVVSLK
jgi:hypothetical protein